MTRCIDPVKNNTDKQNTYRTNISRYNKAMKEGFFLEALLIDYALMEDRLRSFLYHIGLLENRDSYSIDSDRAKKSLKPVIEEYKGEKEKSDFSYKAISGKVKIIRCTLKWADQEDYDRTDKYLAALRQQYDRYVDVDGLLMTLDNILEWCDYRNEVIHALLNKNTESLGERLEFQAKKGMELARFLDDQVKGVKKYNRIRKSINLPDR